MTARLDISLFHALCLLLAVTFCSCSQIYDDEGPCEQEQKKGNGISLKFKIYTESAPTTRTRGLGEWTEPSANIAERILNPQDMRVLLLNADDHLIRSFKPNRLDYVEGKTEEGVITGDGFYELSVYFEDENLDRMDDDKPIVFNVMIFANINSLGGGYITDNRGSGTARNSLQELFTMPSTWFPSESKGIPMYGYLSDIQVTKAQLADEDFVMGNITMLRALSKIEVYDNVEGVKIDGQKYPFVEKVELTSWRDQGYLRPANDRYDTEKGAWALTTANIPTTSPLVEDRLYATPVTDGYGTEGHMDNKNCYRLYCPEAELTNVKLLVTTTLAPNVYKGYEVELKDYIDEYGSNDLVRNHIYRFSVNSLGAKADLTVTVSDWGTKTDEYTLDDIIAMNDEDRLKWDVEGKNNFSVDPDVPQLNILNGTTDYATGKFKIDSKEGAKWRAFFIPGENGVDAFEFVDVDAAGNVTTTHSYVEGTVGSEATIHVRGKGEADVYRHTAELVVEVVSQADGSVLYAPIAGEGKTSYIIYRENKL